MKALTFPVARYRFDFTVRTPIRLPDYSGSLLRGAFGHALRQLACMTRQKDCVGCPLIGGCAYPAVFAPPPPATHDLQKFSQLPAPYVIEPPAWGRRVLDAGETLSFHQVLIGRALRELPRIILAWRRALARGVGAGDGTAELIRVVHCSTSGEEEVYRPEIGIIDEHRQCVDLAASDVPPMSAATLTFTTPLRLQHNGSALPPERLTAKTLLMALTRRASLLAEFHADGPLFGDFAALGAASAEIHENRDLAWRDWARYSSRQQQAMRLGGVIGTWRIEGDLTLFAAALRLGEWLHVGKEATFGLGRYILAEDTSRDTSPAPVEVPERTLQLIVNKPTIAPPQ